jgi:segregation and condensation protein A
MAEYKVQFPVFEGPLDLLLHLVKKQEVDIHDVNLTQLATEFIAYVDLMRELDLELAGEFLVMAATLMYIKSKELLPVEQQVTPEGEEDDDNDPRWELIRQLVEYKKFKDAASNLQEREAAQENTFERRPPKLEFEPEQQSLPGQVSIFELLNAVNSILKRFGDKEEARDIFQDKWTVSEKIEQINTLLAGRPRVKFSDLFAEATSRTEVVVTFLAMLELIRLKRLTIEQPEPFAEIEINKSDPPPAPAPQPETVGDAAVVDAGEPPETN